MKQFARLFAALDSSPTTRTKLDALHLYFQTAPEPDRVWTIALLTGRRPKRTVSKAEVRLWAIEAAGIPDWLVSECHAAVGDLDEAIAHLLPPAKADAGEKGLSHWMALQVALAGQPEDTRKPAVLSAWQMLGPDERYLFNKLITGSFRMTVAQSLMAKALAQTTGQDVAAISHSLAADWHPADTRFDAFGAAGGNAASSRPFALAHALPLDGGAETLGLPADWSAEWTWDGIRCQLIARPGTFALWSDSEDLITDRFPEFAILADRLPPGTVIDAEVVAWDMVGDRPLPSSALQGRFTRKSVSKDLLLGAPARMIAHDLLECENADLRIQPLVQRREKLQAIIADLPAGSPLIVCPRLSFETWADLSKMRTTACARGAEGLLLKRASSAYPGDDMHDDWRHWKSDPYSVLCVLIYAQAGQDRGSNSFTDFTFALREGGEFVPVAKANSGLSPDETTQITGWARRNTLERFGPVRRLAPELVFEIAFDGIQSSPRHKSGVSLRAPRIARWLHDKSADQIDTLQSLRALLGADHT